MASTIITALLPVVVTLLLGFMAGGVLTFASPIVHALRQPIV